MLTLSNQQLQDLLNTKATAEDGTNEILKMVLNAIMYSEREEYLRENKGKTKANGYRPIKINGYGKTLSLAIPRDRLGVFKPLLQMVLKEEETEMENLCYELYKEGLTTRKISKLFDKIFGKSYSRTAVSNMSNTFKEELNGWRQRFLEKRYLIICLDAIHIKVRRETVEGEAFYVALAVKEDYTREVIAIENYPSEGASGWGEVLQKLKDRGVEHVDLVIADGIQGLEDKVFEKFPKATFQKCVTHFKRNILTKTRAKEKEEMASDLASLFDISDNAYTKEKAYERARCIVNKWKKTYPKLKESLDTEELRPYLSCLDFNFKVRRMIYTTNWIERLNKEFRRALKIRNAMPSVDSTLFLLSAIARDMEMGVYAYPIHNLKEEPRFNEKLIYSASE